ncbi:uncharacterized protein PHACADRAFT_152211 [Phanerochaete carnosa HHB-10118-sp]|uniref:HNH domain-containing protein n=1 Tax=Phanerochaete carnosa (strain HHB-10118-sp) TaxID=650164 RepID=K5UNW9_PHACS|nr:uncharacterized protein PHACADRAFT_152211 [Phanerochaete carnosa HHB-10118-sp]EKM51451.1 hypothetical protein PHACADRAFT_152211 [Phanerochaete carnosa HHB-10118-sp]
MASDAASSPQFNAFKDALARRVISRPGFDDGSSDPGELDDFASYLAAEVWPTLPEPLRNATYQTRDSVPAADDLSLDSTPTTFVDSLTSCGMCDDVDSALSFLRKILEDYVSEACAPPPVWSRTRTTECEICEREVPLTYHHLIPREVHAKALKKKWHPEEMLNSVAWLCRPCHSTVHRVASNEELAKSWYTVDTLLEREDIQRWRAYASKQRWGVRRG